MPAQPVDPPRRGKHTCVHLEYWTSGLMHKIGKTST
jgi:hypothetical protein